MHWLALRRINALDSLIRCVLGIPEHPPEGRYLTLDAMDQAGTLNRVLAA
jgi:hypothetical protein